MANFQSSELAKKASVTVETLRYYHKEALLPEPPKTEAGYRCYTDDDLHRVLFIKRCQGLGFSLKEIKELLAIQDDSGQCAEVKALTRQKISNIQDKITVLQEIEATLKALYENCDGKGGVSDCTIVKKLTQ
jgi:MerR family transcriptional regulator, copper efflux regulator